MGIKIDDVLDILDKWEMFYGQRAGRELWSNKPREIQDKDIDKFNADLSMIRDFINSYERGDGEK